LMVNIVLFLSVHITISVGVHKILQKGRAPSIQVFDKYYVGVE
jgi:hypothetical protein